jgi:hypothetical protein
MTSFTVSSPTETRNTYPSHQQIIYCVVDVTIVLVSPKFGDSEHSFILSKKLRPASMPLFQKHDTTRFHLFFGRFHIVDAILRRDILHDSFGCCSKNSATFKAFSQCLSKRIAKVSKLLIKPKH